MNIAPAIRATVAAATDHNRPIVAYRGIALVDVRRDFPSTVIGRTMAHRDPALVQFVSQHHDAVFYTTQPNDADTFTEEMDRLRAVWRHHQDLEWGGIGYHTYGFPSGRLYLVGGFDTQRANVAGRNHQSIAHCSAGDYTLRTPAIATQLVAAMATIAAWAHQRRLLAVLSHHDAALATSPTDCCGATRHLWVPRIPEAIRAIARQLPA